MHSMSRQPAHQPSSSSSLTPGLAVVSALIGLFSAAVFLGLGATLALEGTGRYRFLANLAWVGVALAVLGAILMLWLALQAWRGAPWRTGWGHWLAFLQVGLLLLALAAVVYGNLRPVLSIPLVVGIIDNLALWIAIRSEQ